MNRIRRFFLSRTTILTLIVLSAGAMLVGSLIPQSFLLNGEGLAKWHADYPIFAPVAEKLGLTRIYTHPLFAGVLALASSSLLCSCIEQLKSSWRRTFVAPQPPNSARSMPSVLPVTDIGRIARSCGYLQLGSGSIARYVRNPWGYWGNSLLHAGMLLVIAASFWIAVTQQRGMIQLAEGEKHIPSSPWLTTEKGLFATDLFLQDAVRLDQVTYEFLPSFAVKKIASTLTFMHGGAADATHTVEVNSILRYRGLRVYQGTDFGHAFYVEITEPAGGRTVYQFPIKHQAAPDTPSYQDFTGVPGNGYLLRGKYYVDEERKSLTTENPLLTLRLDRNGQEIGQLPLKVGSAGSIGGYRFRLLKASRWSSLIFVKLTGIHGIFFGFFVIILGAVLNYFTPARELLVQGCPSGEFRGFWYASGFEEFYLDEYEHLRLRLTGESNNG